MITLVPLLASVTAAPLPSPTTDAPVCAQHNLTGTQHAPKHQRASTPQMRQRYGPEHFERLRWCCDQRAPTKFKDRKSRASCLLTQFQMRWTPQVVQKQDSNVLGGAYDTFIVTGDIDAMWQRDSTNQAKPYLRFLRQQRGKMTPF